MRNFVPRGVTVNESKDWLYVAEASGQIIEIVDVAAGEVIDEFTLSEDSVSVRINGFAPHPSDEKAIMQVMRYTKHIDRYTVEGPFVVEYDLRAKEVTDTVPLPDSREAGNVRFRYSPDGETLYFFSRTTSSPWTPRRTRRSIAGRSRNHWSPVSAAPTLAPTRARTTGRASRRLSSG